MELPEGIVCVECPEPVEGLCWVYILLMCNGMLYVGQTHNVAKRIQRHIDGTGARQTNQLKDFLLVFVEGPWNLLLRSNASVSSRNGRGPRRWLSSKVI
ncbi:GIY-YIG nuclease family protein [Cerasicoccus arenae]|nr:GIY-YIG nuclease family protein [Cerasicoccus arenae]